MRAVGQFVRHRSNVALLIILAVGFGIRAFGLSQFAVTHWDEGDIWSGAVWFGTLGHNGRYHDQVSPPLPSVLFGVFAWPFGLNPRAAVWLSALLGTASIGLMYLLVCRLASTRAALIASGLLALSGLHIMYSRSLLTEPFYVFFLLGALLSSMEYLRTRALKWVLLTAVSASCLQLTKYNGCLVALPLLTVLAYEIVTRRDQSDRARALRHSFLLGGLIAATIGANITALALSKVLPEFIRYFSRFVGGAPATPGALLGYLQLIIPIPVLCTAFAGIAYALWKHRSAEWTVVHLGFLLYVAFVFNYTFYLRLLAPISTFLIIYVALMTDALLRSRKVLAYAAVGVVTLAIGIELWRNLPRYVIRDFGGYARAGDVLHRLDEGVPVLMITQRTVWSNLPGNVRFMPTGPPKDLAIPADTRRVYVVTDLYVYYKYNKRLYLNALVPFQNRLIARVPNPLPYDVVENNLTLSELGRLEKDPAFREQVLSISVFELTGDEARRALTRHPAPAAKPVSG